MVDLRVHVVGPSGHHQDGPVLSPGLLDVGAAGGAEIFFIGVVGGIGSLGGGYGLPLGHLELVEEPFAGLALKVLGTVQAKVGV